MNQSIEAQQTITYDDKIVRQFLWATMVFGIIGMLVGVLAALQLAWWPANSPFSFLSFGRIRPLHTNAVIFAFAGNAFFVALYYSLQRLLKTRMWSDALSQIHFWGWQFIILAAAITLPLGLTQGKEYAELEWQLDIAIALIWVVMTVNVFATLAIRRVKHLYVAIWFYLGSILAIAMLHIVNSLAIPVDAFKSYQIYAGVQDALVQWWYGHNAVGFLLTTPFLGLMYYFVPKAAGKPVYSYRLSIVHFWSLVFLYIWAGPHHLLYSALPEWTQSLGMVFSLMLIAPSWGGMLNGLLTLRGVWHKLRTDHILRFFVMAITFYGMSTLEGSLLSIKSLNLITHDTDYTIAHVHGGALGWVGGMVFGMAYYLAPKLWKVPLYSLKLANLHFWVATIGVVLYVTSMWTAGITQGLMWFATNEDGSLLYPQFIETVEAIKPLYWLRLIGGSMYLFGAILCLYNLWKTALAGGRQEDESCVIAAERHIEAKSWHERLEHKSLLMAVLSAITLAIGGLVEMLPTFLVEANVPSIASVKPYTPLELEGRDIYVKEGCYNCHSQMVRTHEKEIVRYGQKSEAGEFVYDHPFQWGSKRTGPDLHRIGGKYPDLWHYKHMLDPRSTSPGSIMPAYPWLSEQKISSERLQKKLEVMQKLGVPYDDDMLTNVSEKVQEQAQKIQASLKEGNVELAADSELIALIAYLQRLGTDIKKVEIKN